METDLMFCCGFNPNHSQKLADWVTKKGRINWSEIEAELYNQGIKRDKVAQAMLLYSPADPRTVVPLSGPIMVLTKKATVLDLIDISLNNHPIVCFTELRKIIWMVSNTDDGQNISEPYWLDLEFSPAPSPGNGPQYKAVLQVLNQNMHPYPTSF